MSILMECRKNKIMEALDSKTKVPAEVQACFDALKKRSGKYKQGNRSSDLQKLKGSVTVDGWTIS